MGEVAALATALLFALCSVAFAFAGRRVDALAVNAVRILTAFVVLTFANWLLSGDAWPSVDAHRMWLLVWSGVIGLALGDLFLFHCYACIGPRIGCLLMAFAPALTALLAWPVLGERIGVIEVVGIAIVTAGVMVVILGDRGGAGWEPPPGHRARGWAICCGLLGALGQAGGLVLSKLGMAATEQAGALDALPATAIRMGAGAVCISAVVLLSGKARVVVKLLRDSRARMATLWGTVAGPILGVWLSLVAVSYSDAGVAAALMAVTPVMMLPISRVAYGARPGTRSVVGTIVAVGGVGLLVLS